MRRSFFASSQVGRRRRGIVAPSLRPRPPNDPLNESALDCIQRCTRALPRFVLGSLPNSVNPVWAIAVRAVMRTLPRVENAGFRAAFARVVCAQPEDVAYFVHRFGGRHAPRDELMIAALELSVMARATNSPRGVCVRWSRSAGGLVSHSASSPVRSCSNVDPLPID